MQTIILNSEDETTAFAEAILPWLQPGDCLMLKGPVGAGKSAFARALIQAQMALDGAVEDVPSPTFTLVQTYETSKGAFWHADLYRLSEPDETQELGLASAMNTAITLIEWPGRLGSYLPPRYLTLDFTEIPGQEDARRLTISPVGDGWSWLETVL